MFIRGRVAPGDGSVLPSNVMVERICNTRVRQQVYATLQGDFNMQLGSMADSFVDASGDREGGLPETRVTNKPAGMGIPRRELQNCELRTSVTGFRPSVLHLMDLSSVFGGSLDVGSIVVQRAGKVEGLTLNAVIYQAPKNARKAYEKGLEASKNGKLVAARGYFEKAVEIYPKFAHAWFELGTVLRKENQKEAARTAYNKAATLDTKFLPPYLYLAAMAHEAANWPEVIELTNHILDLNPFKGGTGYVLDLDPYHYAEAYFYNAFANFKLNRIDEAEKNALKAERDLWSRSPQLHLLLAEISTRKNKYAVAIAELQSYLELVPNANDAERVRERLAKLEKLNASGSAGEKTDKQ